MPAPAGELAFLLAAIVALAEVECKTNPLFPSCWSAMDTIGIM